MNWLVGVAVRSDVEGHEADGQPRRRLEQKQNFLLSVERSERARELERIA